MKNFKKVVLGVALSAATSLALAGNGEIAVIVKSANSNYWQNVQKGVQETAKQHANYKVTFQGPASESAIADEVNMVVNAVNRGVSGIVLAPTPRWRKAARPTTSPFSPPTTTRPASCPPSA